MFIVNNPKLTIFFHYKKEKKKIESFNH